MFAPIWNDWTEQNSMRKQSENPLTKWTLNNGPKVVLEIELSQEHTKILIK